MPVKPNSTLLRIILAPWSVYRKAVSVQNDYQVFHFHDPELLGVGLILRILTRKKIVYDVHEDVPEDILLKHWIPKKCGISFRTFMRDWKASLPAG